MMTIALDKMNFFAPTELGRTRKITPEGFLLCEGVNIARTGEQSYRANEVPVEGDKDGLVIVTRTPEEVFREETIASFEGKPVTVEHPNEFVTPETWKDKAIGTIHNVRRGSGVDDDKLVADLLITDASAIAYVNNSLPELSCGYKCDYVQTEPGRALQQNILGNHVALVDRGRAGPQISVKDHLSPVEYFMAKSNFASTIARLFHAVQTKDDKTLDAIQNELESKDEDLEMMDSFDKRMKAVEDWMNDCKARDSAREKEAADAKAKAEKEAEDAKARDAILAAEAASARIDFGKTWTGDSLKRVISLAEILSPGLALPTVDSLNAPEVVQSFVLKSLTTADATDAGKACIAPFLMGRDYKTLTGDALMGVFNGAAELMRQRNNTALRMNGVTSRDFGKNPPSNAELNAQARARWAAKK